MPDFIADEAASIALRAKRIKEEETVPPLSDASGAILDWYGDKVGLKRNSGEGDYAYRVRVTAAS